MINSEEEFQAEKTRLQVEAAAANKRFEEAQTKKQQLLVDTQLQSAYSEAGGIGADDDGAYQAIKSYLKIEIEDGQIVIKDKWGEIEKNADGTAKSVQQKMAELKKNPTFKTFFKADAVESKKPEDKPPLSPGQYYFSREQAMAGKVKIEDINSGKAVPEPRKPNTPMEGLAQRTKTVNPEKILRGE
jgi:hypothetical protein